jgi:hypothetical protein
MTVNVLYVTNWVPIFSVETVVVDLIPLTSGGGPLKMKFWLGLVLYNIPTMSEEIKQKKDKKVKVVAEGEEIMKKEKKEKKDKKRKDRDGEAVSGDIQTEAVPETSTSTSAATGSDPVVEETKEERRARKKAKKEVRDLPSHYQGLVLRRRQKQQLPLPSPPLPRPSQKSRKRPKKNEKPVVKLRNS